MASEKQTIDGPIPLVIEEVAVPRTPEEIEAQEKRMAELERELDADDGDEGDTDRIE